MRLLENAAKMQAGERNIQLYNRLGNRQPNVPPYCGSRRVINSPSRSSNSADTRLSRFLGSGRMTGKPHLTGCLPVRIGRGGGGLLKSCRQTGPESPRPLRNDGRLKTTGYHESFRPRINLDHIEKGSVLIESGRIVSVERRNGAKKPAGATVVSGEGQFLIPGLIDSHVHLASIPGMSPEVSFGQAEGKPAMIKGYFKQLPRSYLYFGYTTLVDLAVVDRRSARQSG
jgi:hypothetical protein